MKIGNLSPHVAVPCAEMSAIPPGHAVVAVVIEWRGKIALLKRSRYLNHDRGLWHCITGYLEPGASPKQQALEELLQEAGLDAASLLDLRAGPNLVINDDDTEPWLVHTFAAVTSRRRLEIDWEHDSYRWIAPDKVKRFINRESWLDHVLHATGFIIPGSDIE
jgi:8-oxo-dGTP pyrophosphatase MutT (NUDIX family)